MDNWEETEEHGNAMADAIDELTKCLSEFVLVESKSLTHDQAFAMGMKMGDLVSKAGQAADNWRTHGGRDI